MHSGGHADTVHTASRRHGHALLIALGTIADMVLEDMGMTCEDLKMWATKGVQTRPEEFVN